MAEYSTKLKSFPQQSQSPYTPYKTQKRFVRKLGFGIKTPETAINSSYIDKKCPFTGEIKIIPHFIKGTVIKMKNEKTIVVRKNYLFYHTKYKRYERRNTKFNVHLSPCFFGLIQVGDNVTCAETRPLSKTKYFVVVDYVKSIHNARGFKVLA
ncbi:archaeal ribosomal protein S17P [Edhazardia aedis USNM 41457]|uniref:Archaeal ribosomal protein S17P n=1 Tax=Edhazardia aedis (strain USNM 41457) TaxID=1003232 RepID=J9D4F6_EDHAE|nr:archaeal ribosomal protein S17P [Edhazardia aedis USNM 41457]|eukprot:EJW02439.1 archaeal ribosomal protein S17P [Edhazardia aedis USNM 41457]